MIAGAKPNVIRSANESSCAPNGESTFNNLAINPSSKSKNAATIIRSIDTLYHPEMQNKPNNNHLISLEM